MAETVSEARVAELIQAAVENLQQQMSSALRAEFSATAVAAEARLGHVQSEMSADLRREFEATRESFDERIRTLTNSIDFERSRHALWKRKMAGKTTPLTKGVGK